MFFFSKNPYCLQHCFSMVGQDILLPRGSIVSAGNLQGLIYGTFYEVHTLLVPIVKWPSYSLISFLLAKIHRVLSSPHLVILQERQLDSPFIIRSHSQELPPWHSQHLSTQLSSIIANVSVSTYGLFSLLCLCLVLCLQPVGMHLGWRLHHLGINPLQSLFIFLSS